jgi:hypothetical protein
MIKRGLFGAVVGLFVQLQLNAEHKQLKSPNWRTNSYLLWSDRTACRKVHRLTQPTRPVKAVERKKLMDVTSMNSRDAHYSNSSEHEAGSRRESLSG